MRKQDKIVLWPAYFDSTKTRNEGRRILKSMSVPLPKILELKEAAEKLHFQHELVENASYPKTPWLKSSMLLVKKSDAKDKIIKKIAKQLLVIRSTQAKK